MTATGMIQMNLYSRRNTQDKKAGIHGHKVQVLREGAQFLPDNTTLPTEVSQGQPAVAGQVSIEGTIAGTSRT